jgi:hypothetical protein
VAQVVQISRVNGASTIAVRATARAAAEGAIAALVAIASDPDAADRDRIAACREILDRAVGKPPTSVTVTDDSNPVREMSRRELLAIVAEAGKADA